MSAFINSPEITEPVKKKKKHSLEHNGSDSDNSLSKPKKLKKSKKLSNGILSHPEKNGKFLQFKDTKYYTSVIANPDSLKLPPQIFQKNNFRNSTPDNSESFLFNLISMKSFNTNVNERFNYMSLINENRPHEEEEEETIQRRISHNESNTAQAKKKEKRRDILESNNESFVNEEENFSSQVAVYKVKDNKGLMFCMHHRSSFSFQGEIKITILSGEVEILGYTLCHSSSTNSVDVYSPNFYTAVVVETKVPKESTSKTEIESVLKNYLEKEEAAFLLAGFRSNDVVLFIEQINSTVGAVVNKYNDTPLFPKDLQDFTSDSLTVKCIQSVFNFKLPRNGKHFKKNPQWDSIPLGGCSVLCGGKGVGKSTLLKYFVNKLVSQGEKVLCLDLDVGQSEFTAPGCVSAVVVDQPLLGPNFTHVIDPALMFYFGDIDVAQNPSGYLECVQHVIESCKKNVEFSRMKWFVNTMGFNKGLGVFLMTSIIKLLQPNTVIQIQGPVKSNYPFFLTSTNLNSMPGFQSVPLEDVHLSHDLRIVNSYAGTTGFGKRGEASQGAMKPRALRDIMSLAYFGRMVSPHYNFNAVRPYLIHFSKIYLGIHSLIDLNDVLKAFNANIVSLSTFKPDSEEIYTVDADDEDYFKIVVKPKIAPCVGLGFVRGIDCKEKNFYVMTHLRPETLNRVNCLCLGRISPPHSIFLKQDAVEGQSPYTTFGTQNIIQRVKRMFHGSTSPQKFG